MHRAAFRTPHARRQLTPRRKIASTPRPAVLFLAPFATHPCLTIQVRGDSGARRTRPRASHRFTPDKCFSILTFSCEPERGRSAKCGFQFQGRFRRDRRSARDEFVDVFLRETGSRREIGLRPPLFVEQIGDRVAGRRNPVGFKARKVISHGSHQSGRYALCSRAPSQSRRHRMLESDCDRLEHQPVAAAKSTAN